MTLLERVLSALLVATAMIDLAVANAKTVSLEQWSLYSSSEPSVRYNVSVPNTVVGALLNTTRYQFDPFYGKNLELIDEEDFLVPWIFETQFSVPSGSWARMCVRFEGINYKATLVVNGITVANTSVLIGALRRHEIDVTSMAMLRPGASNLFQLTVWSQKHDPGQWRNNATDLSINFQDWNPHPPDLSMGLFRPVDAILFTAEDLPITIDGFAINPHIPVSLPGSQFVAYANCSFVVKYWGIGRIDDVVLALDLGLGSNTPFMLSEPFSLEDRPSRLEPFVTRVFFNWLDHPQLIFQNETLLWWPWQMGQQTQHIATVKSADGASIYGSASYGIREVRQELNEGGSLQFFVNNVPIMFRGGGWTSEMFLREKNYTRLFNEFTLIRDMGMNGLRLEGMVETDLFLDMADKFGVMLLPGIACCDGWQHWWEWPQENYEIARRSVIDQARRLSRHPSVVGFFESSDNLPPPQLEAMYLDAFVEESWPNALISSASQDVSNVTGNPGVKMVGPYSWVPPNYWLLDGNGNANGNYGGAWGFFTEGGPGEAPMTFSSWQRTVPKEHLWSNLTQSMDSWWSFHMGEPFGHFRNLTYYTPPLDARYGPSNSAKDYLRKAQAANFEGIRAFMEGYSRNKHINATGFVQWLMNNAWPSHLWHLYDFYLAGGGGYYGAKLACEELHLMYSYNDGTVWIINSRFFDFVEVNASVTVADLNGRVVYFESLLIPIVVSDASLPLSALTVPRSLIDHTFGLRDTYFVILSLKYTEPSGGNVSLRDNWYWLSRTEDIPDFAASNGYRTPCASFTNFSQLLTLRPAALNITSTQTSSNSANVVIQSPFSNNIVAFFVHVALVGRDGAEILPQLWSDNYVSLLPGGVKSLELLLPGNMTMTLGENAFVIVESWNDQN